MASKLRVEKKSRREREQDRHRQRVYIRTEYTRWCSVKDRHKLVSHEDTAKFLLDCYEKYQKLLSKTSTPFGPAAHPLPSLPDSTRLTSSVKVEGVLSWVQSLPSSSTDEERTLTASPSSLSTPISDDGQPALTQVAESCSRTSSDPDIHDLKGPVEKDISYTSKELKDTEASETTSNGNDRTMEPAVRVKIERVDTDSEETDSADEGEITEERQQMLADYSDINTPRGNSVSYGGVGILRNHQIETGNLFHEETLSPVRADKRTVSVRVDTDSEETDSADEGEITEERQQMLADYSDINTPRGNSVSYGGVGILRNHQIETGNLFHEETLSPVRADKRTVSVRVDTDSEETDSADEGEITEERQQMLADYSDINTPYGNNVLYGSVGISRNHQIETRNLFYEETPSPVRADKRTVSDHITAVIKQESSYIVDTALASHMQHENYRRYSLGLPSYNDIKPTPDLLTSTTVFPTLQTPSVALGSNQSAPQCITPVGLYCNTMLMSTQEPVPFESEGEKSVLLVSREDESERLVAREDESERLVSREDESERLVSREDESERLVSREDESERLVSREDESERLVSGEDVSKQLISGEDESERLVSREDESERLVSGEDESERLVSGEDESERLVSREDESERLVSGEDESEQLVSGEDDSGEDDPEWLVSGEDEDRTSEETLSATEDIEFDSTDTESGFSDAELQDISDGGDGGKQRHEIEQVKGKTRAFCRRASEMGEVIKSEIVETTDISCQNLVFQPVNAYRCYLCGKSFGQLSKLQRHEDTHEGEEPFTNKINSKSFTPKSSLQMNQLTHAGEKTHKCDICNRSFLKRSSLKNHHRTHIDGGPYACRFCGSVFQYPSGLRRHEQQHTRENCSICSICGQSVTRLYEHVRTHTGEKPHTCSVCNKSFATSSELRSHGVTHTGKKSYICSYCGKAFGRLNELRRHEKTHTGEKPHTCSVCSKSFAVPYHLRRHKLIHTGEKPYTCSICNRGFSQSGALQNHIRTHTGEKPHVCSICSKAFHSRAALLMHRPVHTREKHTPVDFVIGQF